MLVLKILFLDYIIIQTEMKKLWRFQVSTQERGKAYISRMTKLRTNIGSFHIPHRRNVDFM